MKKVLYFCFAALLVLFWTGAIVYASGTTYEADSSEYYYVTETGHEVTLVDNKLYIDGEIVDMNWVFLYDLLYYRKQQITVTDNTKVLWSSLENGKFRDAQNMNGTDDCIRVKINNFSFSYVYAQGSAYDSYTNNYNENQYKYIYIDTNTKKAVGSEVDHYLTWTGFYYFWEKYPEGNREVTGITMDPASMTLMINQTEKLNATVTPARALNKRVTWVSTNNSIVSVNANGEVTGVSEGTAFVIATTEEGGFPAVCSITVSEQGTGNLALGATASSNSVLNNNRKPQFAIDGDYDTNWSAAESVPDIYLELDFGEAKTFSKVVIDENGRRIGDYSLQIWNGSSWIDIVTGNKIGSFCEMNFNQVTSSKIRLYIHTMANTNRASINEFEVYK